MYVWDNYVPNIESNYTAVFSYNQENVCEQSRYSQPPTIYTSLCVAMTWGIQVYSVTIANP